MKVIVIPLTAIITLIALGSYFSFISNVSHQASTGDVQGIVNTTTEEVVNEVKDTATTAVIAPFIGYIIAAIVFIGSLFGIIIKFT